MLIGEPLHPYEMQRRMKHWGKDRVVNVGQRANLYRTIERLQQAGLIAVLHTERDKRFPERTIYQLTEDGLRIGRRWLDEMISTPRNEFPEFPAALSLVFGLTPQETISALERRVARLREDQAVLDRDLNPAGRRPPRVTLLETEYLQAMMAAELMWLGELLDDLRKGALSWSGEELARTSQQFLP
jgi:DNA-binding PadR family transcriptional regulator